MRSRTKRTASSNEEINLEENLSVLQTLDENQDLGLFYENTSEEAGVGRQNKIGRTQKGSSFVDEAARIAEIDAFLFCGDVDGAMQVFNRCRRKGHKFDVSIFNMILHGLAAKRKVLDFQVFYHNMAADDVVPNIQTYAASLELYGKMKDINKIYDTCNKIENQGYDLRQLFGATILTREQANCVLEALRLIRPDYEAEKYERNTEPVQISPLVQPLYENVRTDAEYDTKDSSTNNFEQDVMALVEKQLRMEKLGFATIKSVEKKRRNANCAGKTEGISFTDVQNVWRASLTEAIEREIELVKAENKGNKRRKNGPFARIMTPCDEYADLAIETITGPVCSQAYGTPLNYLCWLVGTQVYNRYAIRHKEKSGVVEKIKQIYEKFAERACDPVACKTMNSRELWLQAERSTPYDGSVNCDIPPWPSSVRVLVGCTLINMMIKDCKINGNIFNYKKEKIVPAFFHTYESEHTTNTGYVKAHPTVIKLYQEHVSNSGDISLPSTRLPMFVPPRPWTSITDGGHLLFSGIFPRVIFQKARIGLQKLK